MHQPSTLPTFLCSVSSSCLTSTPLHDPVSLLTLAFLVSNKLVVALWNYSNVLPPAICCKAFCRSACLYICMMMTHTWPTTLIGPSPWPFLYTHPYLITPQHLHVPNLHSHQSTLSVHSSPNSFQSVHLVSVAYTLSLSHIYIQASVRLAELMWVEQCVCASFSLTPTAALLHYFVTFRHFSQISVKTCSAHVKGVK